MNKFSCTLIRFLGSVITLGSLVALTVTFPKVVLYITSAFLVILILVGLWELCAASCSNRG